MPFMDFFRCPFGQDGSETVDGIFKVKASAPKPRHGLKDVLDEHPQRAPGRKIRAWEETINSVF